MTKTTDLGLGGIVSQPSWGAGGAGFYGDGAVDTDIFPPLSAAMDWAGGLAGGGGSGNGACGGGGGGYSGGDSGWIGGGGGSYDAGLDAILLAGIGTGDGELIITLLQALGLVPNLPAGAPHNQISVASAIDFATNDGAAGPSSLLALYNLNSAQLARR